MGIGGEGGKTRMHPAYLLEAFCPIVVLTSLVCSRLLLNIPQLASCDRMQLPAMSWADDQLSLSPGRCARARVGGWVGGRGFEGGEGGSGDTESGRH